MSTIRDIKLTEEEWLRQMRRDAVEFYKDDLIKKIEAEIEELSAGKSIDDIVYCDPRKAGRIRGMKRSKEIIQSHIILVK